ncbi:xylulokinase [Virgibacillus sp. JSM 102003]|uniref:xylulokinase n=1 Tax=Virgibacillus sp. JSM 102003 TaxID=1562108 RepID=UPI0035C249C5
MKYVIGVDLGTSSVKVILMNEHGEIINEVSHSYSLHQPYPSYSEQYPEEWVMKTILALKEIISDINPALVEGLSFSGQMHGLVLLDKNHNVIRPAILWNDTRTTKQCHDINEKVGEENLLLITKNHALEGFTLPKLLWVKENEPENFEKTKVVLLPKDYLRFRLTNEINMEYSDAAGTLLLDIKEKQWSKQICRQFELDENLLPQLVESHDWVGNLSKEMARRTGFTTELKIFAGGADNACGAVGSGVLSTGITMCSIGTSGVVLSYEDSSDQDYNGKVHYFNHVKEDAYYIMGVTLSAGESLKWFMKNFAGKESFDSLFKSLHTTSIGANGLLFTPYLQGERTPHANADVRGSFVGIDSSHKSQDFLRAVIEGITFSLNESIHLFRQQGKPVNDQVISIGGGAKSDSWLQIQADIFNAKVIKLKNEQGPAVGAAIIAAYGCRWYKTLAEGANQIVQIDEEFFPNRENAKRYGELFSVYRSIYERTMQISRDLKTYR